MLRRLQGWLAKTKPAQRCPAPSPSVKVTDERCNAAYRDGVAHFRRGQLTEADRCFRQALEFQHDFAKAHFYLGVIQHRQGKSEDAGDSLLLATALKPDFAEAWFHLGMVDLDLGREDDARKSFETALRIRPDYADVYNGLGRLCEQQNEFQAAASYYRRAIEINPECALAYSNLAYLSLREFGNDTIAADLAQKAITLNPKLAAAHNNLAMVFQFQGRCREAIAAADRALALEPGVARTRMIRGMARLMLGEFDNGWQDYEARKQVLPTFAVRKFPYPEWDGAEPAGSKILVYCEQGLGDEIMFASCVPDLLAAGALCVVECSPKLVRLFARSFPQATVIAANQDSSDMSYLRSIPHIDFEVAIGSLPLHFRRRSDDFPQHNGYLTADPHHVDQWKGRLRALGHGMKIGLSWRGGSPLANRRGRSLELENLLPLLRTAGAHFISLQYTECRAEIARMRDQHGIEIHHWPEAIDDYDQTAALVTALDQIISVQTALVHLAGALGKPAWVLVPATPEWRYLGEGERMPWYPSVRLFRQAPANDWRSVIDDLVRELGHLRDH